MHSWQIGSFGLKLRRSIAAEAQAAVPQIPAFPNVFGSPFVSTASMDQGDSFPQGSAQDAQPSAAQSTDEDDEDETTVFVESHKVCLPLDVHEARLKGSVSA